MVGIFKDSDFIWSLLQLLIKKEYPLKIAIADAVHEISPERFPIGRYPDILAQLNLQEQKDLILLIQNQLRIENEEVRIECMYILRELHDPSIIPILRHEFK